MTTPAHYDPAELAKRFDLSADEEGWRQHAAAFAAEHLAPRAQALDRESRFPAELVPALGRAGLIAAAFPREAGGRGASALAGCLIAEEIGAVDGSVRGFLAVQAGLVLGALLGHGAAAQKKRWAGPLLAGEAIGCYALTEEGAGSDVGAIATRAREDGRHIVLDGEKVWITNGGVADVALVFATVDPAARTKGLECYLVPTDTPGFEPHPMEGRELGHRASDHARLVLRGVRVPKGNRVGRSRAGFRVAMHGLELGRLNVAAGAVGAQRACLELSTAFARERRQFGSRIGDFQQVSATLAEMAMDLETSRLLTYHAARMLDRGMEATGAVSAAKLHATEAALRTATRAIQLHGSRAYVDTLPLERHYRDVIALTIYEGTSNVQRLILARRLLGRDEPAPS